MMFLLLPPADTNPHTNIFLIDIEPRFSYVYLVPKHIL